MSNQLKKNLEREEFKRFEWQRPKSEEKRKHKIETTKKEEGSSAQKIEREKIEQKTEDSKEQESKIETSKIVEVKIPQFQIEFLSLKPLTELDMAISIAKTEDLPLKIPRFDLVKFTPSKATNLDASISIERESFEKLVIPRLTLITFKPTIGYPNLDTKFEIPSDQHSIKVPRLLLTRFKLVRPFVQFSIDKPVHQSKPTPKKNGEEIVKPITDVHEVQSSSTSSQVEQTVSEPKDFELEEFDVFDLIFWKEGNTLDFDEPLIICLEEPPNDSYIGTLRTICKLIYREKVGGNPKDRLIIETLNELKDELRWIEAEDKIISVKLSEKEWKEIKPEDWTKLWSRIKQLFAQGFGVIIFNRWLDYVGEHLINIVKLKPKELPPKVRKDIVELFWGVSVSEEESSRPFDLLFEIARMKKERLLKRLENLEGGIYWDATKKDENESKEHRLIKAFIARLIVKDLRKRGLKLNTPMGIEEYVKTEYWVSDTVRSDVYADGRVFEIETLFAEDRGGETVRDKLRETFKKYENTNIEEINVVLDNPTFVRHIRTILSLLRNYKDWMKKYHKRVKFYTIDIENERLIPLDELISKLKAIKLEIENYTKINQ